MPTDLIKLDPDWAWSPFEPDVTRPWSPALASHLYRRAGFAATTQQLNEAITQRPAEIVEQLLNPAGVEQFEREVDGIGRTLLAGGNPQSLSAWWLYRMLHSPAQLVEKATLFWHGHFATSAEKVDDARAMLRQNQMLRGQSLGDFGDVVEEISRDPAMLIYLDAATNRKTHPNENYARELMELFCLGPGNYTEKDIQEIARSFTGWEVKSGQFRFNKYQHDSGVKSFLGRSGEFGGEDAVRIVLEQPAAPRFIATKLIKYFVLDEPAPPDTLIEPLAKQLRDDEFHVGPTIRRILGSRLFFSEQVMGRKVRSPVELGVGLLRAFEATTNVNRLAEGLGQLGQQPFYPPNVKGWDGGRDWINSSTLLGRANLVGQLVRDGDTRFAGGDLQSLAKRHEREAPDEIVDWLLQLLVAVSVPAEARSALVELARSTKSNTNNQLATVIHAIATLPEFHLT